MNYLPPSQPTSMITMLVIMSTKREWQRTTKRMWWLLLGMTRRGNDKEGIPHNNSRQMVIKQQTGDSWRCSHWLCWTTTKGATSITKVEEAGANRAEAEAKEQQNFIYKYKPIRWIFIYVRYDCFRCNCCVFETLKVFGKIPSKVRILIASGLKNWARACHKIP